MIILFFALLIPFQFAKHAFMLLGLDEDSSNFAQRYMNIAILGVLFNQLGEATKRLLNAFGYQKGPMVIAVATTAMHVVLLYTITWSFGMGVYGPALAYLISNLNTLVLLTLYAKKISKHDDNVR